MIGLPYRLTDHTWGNFSTHLSKLEEAGYLTLDKTFKGKKPHTIISLTEESRSAFRVNRSSFQQVPDELSD
jgi:DNA-binding transcriptional ArsR family regulator